MVSPGKRSLSHALTSARRMDPLQSQDSGSGPSLHSVIRVQAVSETRLDMEVL